VQAHGHFGDDARRAFRTGELREAVAAEDLRARRAVRTMLPSAVTTMRASTLSRMVRSAQYSCRRAVAAMPPSEALAPGSTEKKKPVPRSRR
jgi:uncharacterized protein (DUF1786 family)